MGRAAVVTDCHIDNPIDVLDRGTSKGNVESVMCSSIPWNMTM